MTNGSMGMSKDNHSSVSLFSKISTFEHCISDVKITSMKVKFSVSFPRLEVMTIT
jgi:hypothetical protein